MTFGRRFLRSTLGLSVVLAGAPLLPGCGPAFVIEPLIGDPPEVMRLLEMPESALETPETIAAAERFYRALVSRSEAIAVEARALDPRLVTEAPSDLRGASDLWQWLATDTQARLDSLAEQIGSNGRALLQTGRFPKEKATADSDTVRVSLVALFLVRRPIRFRPVDGATADRAEVEVEGRDGSKRRLQLIRERGDWRVLQTDFSMVSQSATIRVGELGQPAPSIDPEELVPELPEAAPREPIPADPPPATSPSKRPGGLDF